MCLSFLAKLRESKEKNYGGAKGQGHYVSPTRKAVCHDLDSEFTKLRAHHRASSPPGWFDRAYNGQRSRRGKSLTLQLAYDPRCDLICVVAPFWSLLGEFLLGLLGFAFPSVLISHARMVAPAA
jgi:hypothetical protein